MDDRFENQAILGPDHLPQPFHQIEKKNGHQISHRDFFILTLHLSGKKAEEIAELVGRSPDSVRNTLRKKEVILVRQQLLESYELEFEAVQREVFQVVEDKLRSQDERVQLSAVETWMKYWGKFLPKVDESKLTAEDVVRQILNQQINVSVNVSK